MTDDPAATAPMTVPRVLAGRYELGAVLGRGGMSDVHHAHDLLLDRPVAVKLLRQAGQDDTDRARFVTEARTLAGLTHRGLVTVLDAGTGTGDGAGDGDDAPPFLVMELVEGPTLGQALSLRRIPLPELAEIGAQVAETLGHVHERGIVHRDVKPGNLLLGPHGRVKLADFGIARLLEATAHLTLTGHTIGTAAYLAPEQVAGEPVDRPADVYSLGLVLLEAATGRREYPGTPTESAVARLHRPPVVPPDLPAPWPALLTAMTHRDPALRPTATEVAHALRSPGTDRVPVAAAVATAPTAPAPSTPAAAAPPDRRRLPAVLLAAGAVVALVVAWGAWRAGGDDPTPPPTTPGQTTSPSPVADRPPPTDVSPTDVSPAAGRDVPAVSTGGGAGRGGGRAEDVDRGAGRGAGKGAGKSAGKDKPGGRGEGRGHADAGPGDGPGAGHGSGGPGRGGGKGGGKGKRPR
ncbi:serine/threonine-protein kinase [Nocardioides sp. SYSU D00038]|uniref:serine/threonine-protein kinase n=1 Tax=Nocardioides sp. SYSU D00038 TaxID=2812554 RepID=UPI0019670AC5|nr:serine/threonine-protein kinase [Nocardioides sp. SYSU D00038]